jgi:hypothetical protein
MRVLTWTAVVAVSLGVSVAPASVRDAAAAPRVCPDWRVDDLATLFAGAPAGREVPYAFFMLATAVDHNSRRPVSLGNGAMRPSGTAESLARTRFRVQRVWSRPDAPEEQLAPPAPSALVSLFDRVSPNFVLGLQYLVAVRVEAGAFAAGACGGVYSAGEVYTLRAIAVLDSLIPRR